MSENKAILQGILYELGRTHETLEEILKLMQNQLIEESKKEAEG